MTETENHRTRRAAISETTGKWLALAAFLLLVIVVGAATWMMRLDDGVDEVRDTQAGIHEQVDQLQSEVSVLRDFVDEIQQGPDEEEQAQNEAIANAVRIVPELRDMFCTVFREELAAAGEPCIEQPATASP